VNRPFIAKSILTRRFENVTFDSAVGLAVRFASSSGVGAVDSVSQFEALLVVAGIPAVAVERAYIQENAGFRPHHRGFLTKKVPSEPLAAMT
jgi:hypothetical protein